jgi:hypothetical protein
MRHSEELDLTPSPRLLEILGDLPYKPWQCLAELIDNAFDDFLSDSNRPPDDPPEVRVTLPKATTSDEDALVCVADTGRGMSLERLSQALRAGYSGKARYGSLGLFGMGFNIATARLGYVTEVRTTQAGDPDWLVVEISLRDLQNLNTFKVPVRRVPKDNPMLHGTEVTVRRLRPGIRDALKRPSTVASIREQLGNVYSYLLRSESPVPELPDTALAGRGFRLYVNGTRVQPRLPCVWSASRVVTYQGREIPPIQIINRPLSPALACMNCGHWHRTDVDRCVECDSDALEMRERRIVGWLGIQRYLHDKDFGIDFLRNGRKILVADKSLFTWENPDTGERFTEYPIELPANQGRIVGEIHLDHIPVFYQKNDFERSLPDWINAVTLIRGAGPLQPKKARQLRYRENDSYLGLLFKAFRRNDPGLKCLIPGDGKGPIHETARKWAENFRRGLPEFLTDEKWYEAAKTHEEIKAGLREPVGKETDDTEDLRERTGLDEPDTPTSPEPGARDAGGGVDPETAIETEEQRFGRYRANSRPLLDLNREVTVPQLGKLTVSVFDTREPLFDLDGQLVPSLARVTRGGGIEVYVNGDHEIFREFGRDLRDYAIMEVAETLRVHAHADEKITKIAAEVTRQFPDQRITDAALRERAEAMLRRVRDLMAPIVAKTPAELWAELPVAAKAAAERNAANGDPKLDWRSATEDGTFVAHLDTSGIAALLTARPDLFLDGEVFSTSWAGWSDPAAKNRQVQRLSRLLDTIGEFLSRAGSKSRLELAMARLTLDMLDDEIARSE